MLLPDHIIKKSDTWYFNTKTAKYIHKDKIEGFCERYWEWKNKHSKSVKDKNAISNQKRKYAAELKNAENRWFGKND